MDLLTASGARALSPLLAALFAEDAPGDALLDERIAEAAAGITALTARDVGLGASGTVLGGCAVEQVDAWMEPLARRVTAYRTERLAVGTTEGARAGAVAASDGLKSFSAGSYAETRFDPGQAAELKVLDPDPETHALLWALATDCARAYWRGLWSGQFAPGVAVANRHGMRLPSRGGARGGYGGDWPRY